MTRDEKLNLVRIAHVLRSGAGGNPVARGCAANLINMVGGEHIAAFPNSIEDDGFKINIPDDRSGIEMVRLMGTTTWVEITSPSLYGKTLTRDQDDVLVAI